MSAPRQVIKAVIYMALKAYPHTTYEDVMSGLNWRNVAEARRACIAAVRASFPHLSERDLGALFNRDRASIIYALDADVRERKRQADKLRRKPAPVMENAAE